MTTPDDLLRRIETEKPLADLLRWPADFDIDRRDPVEELRLPTGLPLTVIAGDDAGGSYFLCGDPGGPRPVLYADSEGGATLLGEDLVEAITLLAAYPYWEDLGHGHSAAELQEEFEEDPDYAPARAELLTLLGVTPPSPEEALTRLQALAARTEPDFLPIARHPEGEVSYAPLL